MWNLTGHALILLLFYVLFCLVRPTKGCRRCGGWGSKEPRFGGGQRRQCHRCEGTGRRFRIPALLIYGFIGARRRHDILTARAARRAARFADEQPAKERDEATP